MKKTVFILLVLISENVLAIVDSIPVESTLTDVTVFFNGAQITRKITHQLSEGNHLIIVDKLPLDINPNSIQVSQLKNCEILSVKHRLTSEVGSKKNQNQLDLEDEIDALELRIREI